jgi:ABC-type transport system involved in cytochrome c biogenesis permease component
MSISRRHVRATFRKELREYRHNGSIVWTMAVIPLVFVLPTIINVFGVAPGSVHADLLLYMLGIPALVPAVVAAYSVVGERQQGTLEPVLTTPIWVGIAISTRFGEVRVAQQLGALASFPSVLVTALIAYAVIPASLALAIGGAVLLLLLNGLGWRITSAAFQRERLISSTR